MNKFILTDGQKSVNLLHSDDPSVWTMLSTAPQTDNDILYARVAAAFRAYNLKANTVGSMPFCLYEENGEEFDNSASWENKVGFLPNPSELFRIDTLSYMVSNAVYNLQTRDVLGYKPKGLYNTIPYTFYPVVHPAGYLEYIERRTGMGIERYAPDGKQILGGTKSQLIYMWRLDHTTEILPSPNTEARAIMNAAGEVFYADAWIKHFYERGGVAPTVIAMKGAVSPDKKQGEEQSWKDWILGLGARFHWNPTRVVNADTLEVKQFGSSVTDLKNMEVYEQAIANIAMGTGMPLSLMLMNSANYATAKEEKATWYENDIIPFGKWLAYEYNKQVFHPLGLYLQFHPETLDPQQEDETERASAVNTFMDFLAKCPTYDVFIGTAETFGYELSDGLIKAAEKYFADKVNKQKEMERQMQQAGVTVETDGEPVEQDEQEDKPVPFQAKDEEDEEEKKPAKSEIKANDNSSIIALRIPDSIRAEIKQRYSFVDEETLRELHITLVYLGDNRTLDKVDIIRAVSELGMYQSPIKGTLQGLARFINGQDVDPLVVTFDSPQMPKLYSMLCGVLENYRVPYHKEHGFIPHMTLAYIPKDSEIPIETIEPIEINFSDVYYVDGNVWYPVELTGYENKTKAAKWTPSIDEVKELSLWRDVMLRRHKKGQGMDYEYKPAHGGLPEWVTQYVTGALLTATDAETVKAAFDVSSLTTQAETEPPAIKSDILVLAESLNRYTDALFTKQTAATT